MLAIVHQYAYFFSILFFILPISVAFDAATGFAVWKKLITPLGIFFVLLSILFWSAFDIFWIHGLGSFPSDRILYAFMGVPIEEMMLFAVAFYNIAAIFRWSKRFV